MPCTYWQFLYVFCVVNIIYINDKSWKITGMTVCSYNVTYAFQSQSTLYSCLNVKELLPRNRREIWSLSGYNGNRIHSHLVRKWKLNHLAKLSNLTKWLSVRLWAKWLLLQVPLQSLNHGNILKISLFG